MKNKKYLKTFFEEKEIPFKQWKLEDDKGLTHIINNEVVIEFILNDEQHYKTHTDYLRKIDFHNGDINHYLEFLAKGIINL